MKYNGFLIVLFLCIVIKLCKSVPTPTTVTTETENKLGTRNGNDSTKDTTENKISARPLDSVSESPSPKPRGLILNRRQSLSDRSKLRCQNCREAPRCKNQGKCDSCNIFCRDANKAAAQEKLVGLSRCESCKETPLCKRYNRCDQCNKYCEEFPDAEGSRTAARNKPPSPNPGKKIPIRYKPLAKVKEEDNEIEENLVNDNGEIRRSIPDTSSKMREPTLGAEQPEEPILKPSSGLRPDNPRFYTIGGFRAGPKMNQVLQLLEVEDTENIEQLVVIAELKSKAGLRYPAPLLDVSNMFSNNSEPIVGEGNLIKGADMELVDKVDKELTKAMEKKELLLGTNYLTPEDVDKVINHAKKLYQQSKDFQSILNDPERLGSTKDGQTCKTEQPDITSRNLGPLNDESSTPRRNESPNALGNERDSDDAIEGDEENEQLPDENDVISGRKEEVEEPLALEDIDNSIDPNEVIPENNEAGEPEDISAIEITSATERLVLEDNEDDEEEERSQPQTQIPESLVIAEPKGNSGVERLTKLVESDDIRKEFMTNNENNLVGAEEPTPAPADDDDRQLITEFTNIIGQDLTGNNRLPKDKKDKLNNEISRLVKSALASARMANNAEDENRIMDNFNSTLQNIEDALDKDLRSGPTGTTETANEVDSSLKEPQPTLGQSSPRSKTVLKKIKIKKLQKFGKAADDTDIVDENVGKNEPFIIEATDENNEIPQEPPVTQGFKDAPPLNKQDEAMDSLIRDMQDIPKFVSEKIQEVSKLIVQPRDNVGNQNFDPNVASEQSTNKDDDDQLAASPQGDDIEENDGNVAVNNDTEDNEANLKTSLQDAVEPINNVGTSTPQMRLEALRERIKQNRQKQRGESQTPTADDKDDDDIMPDENDPTQNEIPAMVFYKGGHDHVDQIDPRISSQNKQQPVTQENVGTVAPQDVSPPKQTTLPSLRERISERMRQGNPPTAENNVDNAKDDILPDENDSTENEVPKFHYKIVHDHKFDDIDPRILSQNTQQPIAPNGQGNVDTADPQNVSSPKQTLPSLRERIRERIGQIPTTEMNNEDNIIPNENDSTQNNVPVIYNNNDDDNDVDDTDPGISSQNAQQSATPNRQENVGTGAPQDWTSPKQTTPPSLRDRIRTRMRQSNPPRSRTMPKKIIEEPIASFQPLDTKNASQALRDAQKYVKPYMPADRDFLQATPEPVNDETETPTALQQRMPEEVGAQMDWMEENSNEVDDNSKKTLHHFGKIIPAQETSKVVHHTHDIDGKVMKSGYFIGDGIKLPVKMQHEKDGSVHLELDAHKICNCKERCSHEDPDRRTPQQDTTTQETEETSFVTTEAQRRREFKRQVDYTNFRRQLPLFKRAPIIGSLLKDKEQEEVDAHVEELENSIKQDKRLGRIRVDAKNRKQLPVFEQFSTVTVPDNQERDVDTQRAGQQNFIKQDGRYITRVDGNEFLKKLGDSNFKNEGVKFRVGLVTDLLKWMKNIAVELKH